MKKTQKKSEEKRCEKEFDDLVGQDHLVDGWDSNDECLGENVAHGDHLIVRRFVVVGGCCFDGRQDLELDTIVGKTVLDLHETRFDDIAFCHSGVFREIFVERFDELVGSSSCVDESLSVLVFGCSGQFLELICDCCSSDDDVRRLGEKTFGFGRGRKTDDDLELSDVVVDLGETALNGLSC